MKSFSKFMTIALAVGTLASCSDEIIEKSKLQVKEGDLVATLPAAEIANTRVAVVPNTNGTDFVWAPEDQIQVYKLASLNYSIYNYVSGAGSETGVFSTTGEGVSGDDLYAVTQPQNTKTIYGVSANNDQKAVLTATVEKEYNWETLDADGGTGYKVPTPFWGPATIDGSNINVDFKALTGFMKLDLANVPSTTEAIVLTTHEDFSIDMGASKINGGSNEPLSGTLNAVLDDDAALQADARLAKYDMIRINIPEHAIAKGYILYIPVIAQHYDKLYVLAVSETGRANYTWDAEILREFDDFTQKVYTPSGNVSITSLSLSEMIDLNEQGATSWADASVVIATKAAQNPGRTMRYTVNAKDFMDNTLYIANNIEKNNVELTITSTGANTLKTITEAEFGSAILSPFSGAVTEPATQALEGGDMAKARTVRLNYEVKWPADAQILLPTSNVELNSTVDQTEAIDIFTAATTGVSGYDETVFNAKNAGLIIKGGTRDEGGKLVPVQYNEIDILDNSRGDIYAYQEDTYIKKLVFNGTDNLQNVRLTDALVGEINYAAAIDNNEEINIYTTGSAAIGNTGAEAITGLHKNTPAVYAYWTSRSLTDNALALGFDNKFIYTAAQLQGVGLAAGISEGGGALGDCPSLIATTAPTPVYEYEISKFVNNIWLGGDKYPWLGAQVAKLVGKPAGAGYGTDRNIIAGADAAQALTTAVTINGNGKRLRNMVISTDDPYFIDPHTCCTTCGDLTVKVTEDLGLFRNIKSTKAVTVKNIYLNDALLDTKYEIDDIGSIVGQIYSGDAVTYDNNISTNVRIKAKGDNIGGQAGNVFATKNLNITNPKNNQEVTETGVDYVYVESEGNNVGGIVGLAKSDAAIPVVAPIAKIDWVLAKNGSNAGGVIGRAEYKEGANITGATVEIPSIMATQNDKTEFQLRTTGKNVGGLVGLLISTEGKNYGVKGVVNVKAISEIEAGNQNAGGLIGLASLDDNATANAGVLKIGNNDDDKITVNVGDLTAHNGYAGGYVGNISTGLETLIGTNTALADDKALSDNVTIASLNSAFAAGGLIGGNSIPVTIAEAKNNTLNVTINDITNTWTAADFKGTSTYNYLSINLDNRLKNCGSFGLLVGLENSKDLTTGLTITGSKFITTGGAATATTTGATSIMDAYATTKLKTIFSDAKKEAVLFKLHSDTGSTVPDAATDFYWGDVYGYTGYVKGDNKYSVDGVMLQGDQIFNVATQW